jgi:hypothetical protein
MGWKFRSQILEKNTCMFVWHLLGVTLKGKIPRLATLMISLLTLLTLRTLKHDSVHGDTKLSLSHEKSVAMTIASEFEIV